MYLRLCYNITWTATIQPIAGFNIWIPTTGKIQLAILGCWTTLRNPFPVINMAMLGYWMLMIIVLLEILYGHAWLLYFI